VEVLPQITVEGRRYYAIRDAASQLGVVPRRLYRLVEGEQIPFTRLGRRILIDLQRVAEHLESGGGAAAGGAAVRPREANRRTLTELSRRAAVKPQPGKSGDTRR
jgi:excisionase family DNA binding protein